MLLRHTMCIAILCAFALLLMLFPFSTASAPQQQGIAPQPPGPVDSAAYDPANPDPRDGFDIPGEINPEQKRQAFLDVTNGNGIVGDFDFQVGDNFGTIGNFIPPVLLQSMGGVESDWRQYEPIGAGSQTLFSAGDYGFMQINAGFNPDLFDLRRNPTGDNDLSLLNDTRANIAAGAVRLASTARLKQPHSLCRQHLALIRPLKRLRHRTVVIGRCAS